MTLFAQKPNYRVAMAGRERDTVMITQDLDTPTTGDIMEVGWFENSLQKLKIQATLGIWDGAGDQTRCGYICFKLVNFNFAFSFRFSKDEIQGGAPSNEDRSKMAAAQLTRSQGAKRA